jgi:LPS-assembly protein
MIFTANQLFRPDRFSGFDRIGDANQLAYGLTSRWLSEREGYEKWLMTVGQIRYFSERKVQLCYSANGQCQDNPLILGYVSPVAGYSPIASQMTYRLNSVLSINGDYVWDPFFNATNNGDLNLHFQPAPNRIVNVGFGYLADGNTFFVPNQPIENNSLNQATFAYAWPFTEQWSTLGAYSYNISKAYNMLAFFGIQYDSCCWAARLVGGRTFQNINPKTLQPDYNNNVYFQILLKGLGTLASSDPTDTIKTYLPEYKNIFQNH